MTKEEGGEDTERKKEENQKEEENKKKKKKEVMMRMMTTTTAAAQAAEAEAEGIPSDKVGFHYFRLFSYLSMAILSASIMVSMFIIIQHLVEEQQQKDTLGRQETVIKNQKLIIEASKNITESQKIVSTILNETRRDNTAFFDILANMTKAEGDEVLKIIAANDRLDKIIEYLKIK